MPRIPVCRRVTPFLRLLFATALIPLLLVPGFAFAQANGKLQIFHVDVGQGDGALLISPQGQMAFFDDGTYTDCSGIKNFCSSHGITSVQYHFLSHYHSDHLGCIDDLAAAGVTIAIAGYDRGYSYSSGTYTTYVNTLGAKRVTIAKGQTITLDAGAANPVSIQCVDLNGAGVYSPSGSDENAKSAVYLVTYGNFNEVIGGDLTGDPASGNDVETTVGPEVGDVEVYKVAPPRLALLLERQLAERRHRRGGGHLVRERQQLRPSDRGSAGAAARAQRAHLLDRDRRGCGAARGLGQGGRHDLDPGRSRARRGLHRERHGLHRHLPQRWRRAADPHH
jgi:hypothetical protein